MMIFNSVSFYISDGNKVRKLKRRHLVTSLFNTVQYTVSYNICYSSFIILSQALIQPKWMKTCMTGDHWLSVFWSLEWILLSRIFSLTFNSWLSVSLNLTSGINRLKVLRRDVRSKKGARKNFRLFFDFIILKLFINAIWLLIQLEMIYPIEIWFYQVAYIWVWQSEETFSLATDWNWR